MPAAPVGEHDLHASGDGGGNPAYRPPPIVSDLDQRDESEGFSGVDACPVIIESAPSLIISPANFSGLVQGQDFDGSDDKPATPSGSTFIAKRSSMERPAHL